MRRLALVTMTAFVLLAGCTSGDGSDDDVTPATPAATDPSSTTADPQDAPTPECADVWKAGRTLPADYAMCLEDGQSVTPDAISCTDGRSLIVHDDQFYALTGQKIVEPDEAPLQDTDAFGKAYESCTGE